MCFQNALLCVSFASVAFILLTTREKKSQLKFFFKSTKYYNSQRDQKEFFQWLGDIQV